MKNNWLKSLLPHAIAVLVFLIVTALFCKPTLEGKVMDQHDTGISGWKGSAQNAVEVKEKTGKMPLWNTNVFSGMPNYQIMMEGKESIPIDLNKVIGLGLPKPMNFFFIACICFYILCIVMGLNPVTGILGALAFGYCTYNPVIIMAGHETKMMAIAYMPLLLAGLLLIFNKKYWAGLALATLGAMFELMANHPQISYYFFIIAGIVTIAYLIQWIKNKEYKHIVLSLGLSAVAALVGLGCYSLAYLTTSEYAKYTMRGGKTVEVKDNEVKAAKTSGLDADYAMSYSLGHTEPLMMLMPKAVGGGSSTQPKEDSKVVERLTGMGVPEMSVMQVLPGLPIYWGGMSSPSEGSAGPTYIGAIIFILAVLGFVIVKHPLKWPLLIATILSIFLSWGKYFSGFNQFLLDSLPLYNKFRAPSMALVIASFTIPLMAVITVYTLFFAKNAKELLQANFKKILYTLGGLTVLLGLLYIGQSYSSGFDAQLMQAQFGQPGDTSINSAIIAGLKADRQSIFGGQMMRSILFMAIVLGILFAYLKNIFKPVIAVLLLCAITTIDLLMVDKKYFPNEAFIPKDELQAGNYSPSPINQQILQDKDPHYRVFDATRGMNDNQPSYFHRSIMGYHAAKLRIYQDIIDLYFAGGIPNQQVLNALDVKYIVVPNQQQQGAAQIITNTDRYGAAWFVKAIRPVAGDAEELQAIGQTNLKDTAVVQQQFLKNTGAVVADSTSSINLVKYTNDEIEYSANTASGGFAVFSEVYYPAGWNAYIDGKKTDIVKADYFLRGLFIPAGKHTVKLAFEPATVQKGITISYLSSWLVIIIAFGGFFMQWWLDKKKNQPQKP